MCLCTQELSSDFYMNIYIRTMTEIILSLRAVIRSNISLKKSLENCTCSFYTKHNRPNQFIKLALFTNRED